MKITVRYRQMGNILLIISLYQSLFGFSMGKYFFPEIEFVELQMKEINKDSTYAAVKKWKDYRRIFDKVDILDTVNHFYVSDIDGDNTHELIYYGLVEAAEGYWTIVWKPDGGQNLLIGELYGKIIGIGDCGYISTLARAGSACDCGYANLYRLNDDWIELRQSVAIFREVMLPQTHPISKSLFIGKDGCRLRSQPVVNDKPGGLKNKFGFLRGNALVELRRGTSATATAAFENRKGKTWFFIVLDNPTATEYNIYKEYRRKDRKICGWISAIDLEYE